MLDEEERKNRGRERTIKQKKENFFVTLPVKKQRLDEEGYVEIKNQRKWEVLECSGKNLGEVEVDWS